MVHAIGCPIGACLFDKRLYLDLND
jgi:hypothetical protein